MPKHMYGLFCVLCLLLWGCKASPKDIPLTIHPYYSPEKKKELKTQHEHMKSSIKSLSIYSQKCEKKEEVASTPLKTQFFDEDGKMTEEYTYNRKAVKSRKEFAYDSLGNKVNIRYYNAQDELRRVEQYDDKGYLTLSLRYDTRSREWLKFRADVTYDEEGYILSLLSYDHEEQLTGIEERYAYSAPGLLKEKKIFHRKPGRKEVFLKHMFLNSQGDVEKTIHASLDTTVVSTKHRYNSESMRTYSRSFDEKGRLQEEKTFTYAKEDQTLLHSTHITFDKKVDTLSQIIKEYNQWGKLEELIHYQSSYKDGKTPSVYEKLEYNAQGLLTSREEFKGSKMHTCEKYVYTFY